MSKDLQAQYQRLMKLQTEAQYAMRVRAECAERTVAGIASITPQQINAVKEEVPGIVEVQQFTAEALLKNIDGAHDLACKVFNELYTMLEEALNHFEGQL